MESHICTNCGYEGRPTRPPSDHAGEEDSFVVGILNKLIFVTTFLPIKVNFIVRMLKRGKAKHCPNCGLPLMVKMSSDAGWLAKRKMDIKSGLKFEQPEKPLVGFGKEIILPSDEKPPEVYVAPVPTNLPHLDELLKPESDSAAAAKADKAAEEKPAEITPPKKPVDPDQW